MSLDSLLPLATLLTDLVGTAATHAMGRPWWVAWLGLGLVVVGLLGCEQDKE